MILQQERKRLSDLKMLKTDIAKELYQKYYFTMFEFAEDLKNSNVSEITISDESVVITTRKEGIRLHCPKGDMTAALGQLIMAGTENNEQDMMTALLRAMITKNTAAERANPVFFDIGANIGWYSIYFEKLFKESLDIHAFEPVKTAYKELLKNLALNQSGTIHTNNFGVADKNEPVDFYVSPSLLAASSLANTYQTEDKTLIKGEVRRLDDYCSEMNIWPDFIKCDVEGAELLVFRGAEKTLSEARPLVMTELLRKWSKCFNYHPNDVIDLFRKKNYSCFVMKDWKLRPCGAITDDTVETNFFFLHQEEHKPFLEIDTQSVKSIQTHPPPLPDHVP